jgi:hypothetical protein
MIAEIFLSHSGRDAQRANRLSSSLEQRLAQLGHHVDVFNTSEAEYRYEELQKLLIAGEDWRPRAEKYEAELRSYLREHLTNSVAFLALVTPKSLAAKSRVIDFEMETASQLARERRVAFFVPCVAARAQLKDLPPAAQQFQGVDLNGRDGVARLAAALRRVLTQPPIGA